MKFMILMKATPQSEAGVMPSERLLREMGRFNESLIKAGVLLAGEGLHPSSRVHASGSRPPRPPLNKARSRKPPGWYPVSGFCR